MKENVLDPVYCFEVYISKARRKKLFFFQKGKRLCLMEENIRFTKKVSKNTICCNMKVLPQKVGLGKVSTNHSGRQQLWPLYTELDWMDIHQICLITKHTNESKLSHYIAGSSDKQKQEASYVLSQSHRVKMKVKTVRL